MLTINDFFNSLEKLAPIELSLKMIERGSYDNSGILIKNHEYVKKVLFSLDFSETVVKRAIKLGCDTIVTHHPAIYSPIKELDYKNLCSNSIMMAVKKDINVISMHLNLDFATDGIDCCLSKGLGADKYKIIDYIDETHGYGREFSVNKTTLSQLCEKIKKQFKTKKIIVYGNKNFSFNKVASFCGAGSRDALNAVLANKTDAQVIITSDMPHHVIKELVERQKAIILITHYCAENYGFYRFYQAVVDQVNGNLQTYYFEDKRFL